MKPIEYLCLAILVAVTNITVYAWYLDAATFALLLAWIIGSYREFRRHELAARDQAGQ